MKDKQSHKHKPQYKIYSGSTLGPMSTLLKLITKLRYISFRYYYNLGQYKNSTICLQASQITTLGVSVECALPPVSSAEVLKLPVSLVEVE